MARLALHMAPQNIRKTMFLNVESCLLGSEVSHYARESFTHKQLAVFLSNGTCIFFKFKNTGYVSKKLFPDPDADSNQNLQ